MVRWARTPKRRGVLIKTSEFDFSQPNFFMMAGRSVSHDPLYITLAAAFMNATWNSSC